MKSTLEELNTSYAPTIPSSIRHKETKYCLASTSTSISSSSGSDFLSEPFDNKGLVAVSSEAKVAQQGRVFRGFIDQVKIGDFLILKRYLSLTYLPKKRAQTRKIIEQLSDPLQNNLVKIEYWESLVFQDFYKLKQTFLAFGELYTLISGMSALSAVFKPHEIMRTVSLREESISTVVTRLAMYVEEMRNVKRNLDGLYDDKSTHQWTKNVLEAFNDCSKLKEAATMLEALHDMQEALNSVEIQANLLSIAESSRRSNYWLRFGLNQQDMGWTNADQALEVLTMRGYYHFKDRALDEKVFNKFRKGVMEEKKLIRMPGNEFTDFRAIRDSRSKRQNTTFTLGMLQTSIIKDLQCTWGELLSHELRHDPRDDSDPEDASMSLSSLRPYQEQMVTIYLPKQDRTVLLSTVDYDFIRGLNFQEDV